MKLFSKFVKAIKQFNLIENGDKIVVGLSGGKDSLTLVDLFSQLKKTKIVEFEVCAVMIDMFNGKYDFSSLQQFCDERNIELKIIKTDIFEILFEVRKEKSPCSLCSKMRKGQLVAFAKELGFNKLALGHHADDFIETFFLSLVYEARLSTFEPLGYLSREQIYQIRPMIYIFEDEIKNYTKDFPIFVNPCPADKFTKREIIKQKMKEFEVLTPNFKKNMLSAILDPSRRQNLLKDKKG